MIHDNCSWRDQVLGRICQVALRRERHCASLSDCQCMPCHSQCRTEANDLKLSKELQGEFWLSGTDGIWNLQQASVGLNFEYTAWVIRSQPSWMWSAPKVNHVSYTGWPKKLAPFLYTLTLKILTDFQNYFAVRISRKFVIILSLKIPPHFKCVATLAYLVKCQVS